MQHTLEMDDKNRSSTASPPPAQRVSNERAEVRGCPPAPRKKKPVPEFIPGNARDGVPRNLILDFMAVKKWTSVHQLRREREPKRCWYNIPFFPVRILRLTRLPSPQPPQNETKLWVFSRFIAHISWWKAHRKNSKQQFHSNATDHGCTLHHDLAKHHFGLRFVRPSREVYGRQPKKSDAIHFWWSRNESK